MTTLSPKIIFEDDDIIVFNKPAGLVVNKSESQKGNFTLQDWLIEKLHLDCSVDFMSEGPFFDRSGIVHRLDKDTSGIIVAAKNKSAFDSLQKQFRERMVVKEYVALVHGDVLKITGENRFVVDAPIGRNPKNRMKWAVVDGGRRAVTEFEVLSVLRAKRPCSAKFSFLKCYPKTGRTHQIRVHLTALNCPIVSDSLYLNKKRYREDSKWCGRLFLHAKKLKFIHPKSGEWVEYSVEMPKELEEAIRNRF